MSITVKAPKGTRDVLPAEISRWSYAEGILRGAAADFGFSEIRFPTLEHTELFERGVGDTTDVVQKEMYTFNDKGGRSVTLRPEGTASVVRSFIENSLDRAGLPVKVFYIAPNFRYDRPQAGRLREFHQFGVEYFGAASPEADAEVIGLADTALRRLGITTIHARINSIGCPECRKAYNDALREYFRPHLGELCETCLTRFEKNPMRLLDCKSPVCSAIASGAPATLDYLCDECAGHFTRVRAALDGMGVPYEVDPGIVRGLDYYTRTVFEFVSDGIGAQGAVCAGGRYDGLVSQLGGAATPGLGFAAGIERLLLVMEAAGIAFPEPMGPELFIASLGEEAVRRAGLIAHRLRQAGISVERDTLGRSLKAQMKLADRLGARRVLMLGDNELASGIAPLKDMAEGGQTETGLEPAQLIAALGRS